MTYAIFENDEGDIEAVKEYYEDKDELVKAREREDALRYFELCNDTGIFPELSDKKAIRLYSIGEDEYNEQRENDSALEEIVDKEGEKLEKIARTALVRFPELQRGETIYNKEISKRLSEIRAAGYDVPSYGKLRKEEKWDLLMKIRRDLWSKLQISNPTLAKEIKTQNQK